MYRHKFMFFQIFWYLDDLGTFRFFLKTSSKIGNVCGAPRNEND